MFIEKLGFDVKLTIEGRALTMQFIDNQWKRGE